MKQPLFSYFWVAHRVALLPKHAGADYRRPGTNFLAVASLRIGLSVLAFDMRLMRQLVFLSLPSDVCFSAAAGVTVRLQVNLCTVKVPLYNKTHFERLEANYSRYVHVNL